MDNPATCETCIWWERGGAQIAKAAHDPSASSDVGTCQVQPPKTVKVVGSWVEAVFPVVHATRFCGAWEDGPGGDEPEDPAREEIPAAPVSNVFPMERAA